MNIIRMALALTTYDEEILQKNNRNLFDRATLRKEETTPDDTYIVIFWEYPNITKPERCKLMTDIRNIRHSYVEITDDGVWMNVKTSDRYGTDEEFREILDWKADIILWEDDEDVLKTKEELDSEEERIFRKVQHEYRLQDAETYLRDYVSSEDIDPNNVFKDADDAPEDEVTLDDLVDPESRWYCLEALVDKYEFMEDSNVAEADIWFEAVRQLFC